MFAYFVRPGEFGRSESVTKKKNKNEKNNKQIDDETGSGPVVSNSFYRPYKIITKSDSVNRKSPL